MAQLTRRFIFVLIVAGLCGVSYMWYESARTVTVVVDDTINTLPEEIILVRGVRDVLVIENTSQSVVTVAGTTLAPGQQLRQYYRSAGEYLFTCSIHNGTSFRVIVREP